MIFVQATSCTLRTIDMISDDCCDAIRRFEDAIVSFHCFIHLCILPLNSRLLVFPSRMHSKRFSMYSLDLGARGMTGLGSKNYLGIY